MAGAKPKHYGAIITNLTTGRTMRIHVPGPKRARKSARVSFSGLWPGDSYRVGVQTFARNSRYDAENDPTSASGQTSGWATAKVTLPSGDKPSYKKKAPALILRPVAAGEATPPWMLGKPTSYVVSNFGSKIAGDIYKRFDAPKECLKWQNPHAFIRNNDQAAYTAIKAAQGQQIFVDNAKAALQKAKDDGQPVHVIANKQREVDATEARLATLVAAVGTECKRAYPVVENLTQADKRWYEATSEFESPRRGI